MSRTAREILMVLAFAAGGLLLAAVVALSPWHPGAADRSAVIEVRQ